MNLWIRKQDGESLMMVDTIWIAKNESDGGYDIRVPAVPGSNMKLTVANYKTKEKAMEILDEVQDFLIGKYQKKNGKPDDVYRNTVYIFPKEE